MEDRQGPGYVLARRQRRPLARRLAACGATVSARPALVVSHLLLRPRCQQALHALATFARTSIGLHHIPPACSFPLSRQCLPRRRPLSPQVQLSCHPAGSALAAPTAHRSTAPVR
jgi:hypothetical protein